MKIAIILAVENNEGIRTGKGEKFRYEDELFLCCSSWRKYAGRYKDIPIFAICPSKKVLPEKAIDKISGLGVNYIQEYFPEVENYPCAWYNKPRVCSWFEQETDFELIIHLDLDCYLIKEVDGNFLTIPKGYDAKIAYYSEKEQKDFNSETLIEYNTGCIVAERGFYTKWYETLMKRLEESRDESHKYLCELEEAVLSEGGFKIYNWVDPTLEDVYLYRRYDIKQYYEQEGRFYFFHDHVSNENLEDLIKLMMKVHKLNGEKWLTTLHNK